MEDLGTSEHKPNVKISSCKNKRAVQDDGDEMQAVAKKKRKTDLCLRREVTVNLGIRETKSNLLNESPNNSNVLLNSMSTCMDFDLNRQETSMEVSDVFKQNCLLSMTKSPSATVKTESSQMDTGTSFLVVGPDSLTGDTSQGILRQDLAFHNALPLQSGLTHNLISMNIKQEPSTIEMTDGSCQLSMHAKKHKLNNKYHEEHESHSSKKMRKYRNRKGYSSKGAKNKEKLKIVVKTAVPSKTTAAASEVNCSEAGVIVKCEPTAYYDMDLASGSYSGEDFAELKLPPAGRRSRFRKTKPRKPAPCTLCQRVFCSFSSLKRHNISMHSADNVPVSCSTCGAVFNKAFKLQAHVRKEHDGDRAFPCSDCDLVFTRACHLRVHMRKHTGERPFKCEVEGCGSTFRCTSNLNRHMQKHSGLRPFVCTVCQADFYQSSHLVSHIRKHTGERPFKCNRCDASFRQLTHLHRHRVKHTGVKPHVCSICGLGFVEKCTLTKHVRDKHNKPGKPTASMLIASMRKKKSARKHRKRGNKSAA